MLKYQVIFFMNIKLNASLLLLLELINLKIKKKLYLKF